MSTTIQEAIDKGEGRKVEFKRQLPKSTQLARTAVSFANGGGGDIIVGVESDGTIVGVPDENVTDLIDTISNTISDSVSPLVLVETFVSRVDESALVVARIYPGPQKPYFLKSEGKANGVYVRVGASNRKADIDTITELDRQRRHVSFDEETLFDVTVDALDLDLLKNEFQRITGSPLTDADIRNLKLLRQEAGEFHPTVGGILLAGRNALNAYTGIKCARFKGTTPEVFIDKKEFLGPLYQCAESAMAFLRTHIPLHAEVEGLRRIEQYEIPMLALREAVLNAVVHRDYTIKGADVKIAIFDDMVEITSPGTLPSTLDIDDVLAGRSEIRNRVLGRFFEKLGWIEQWGTGVRKMMRLCKEQGVAAPVLKESGSFLQITFSRIVQADAEKAGEGINEGINVPLNVPLNVSLNVPLNEQILDLVRKNPGIQRGDLAKHLNVTEKTVSRHLSTLISERDVEHRGSKKTGGYYPVKPPSRTDFK